MTFDNATFASLGITPGTYTWNLPDDSFVIEAGVAATPLAAARPLFAGGLGLVGFLARRRKQKAALV